MKNGLRALFIFFGIFAGWLALGVLTYDDSIKIINAPD